MIIFTTAEWNKPMTEIQHTQQPKPLRSQSTAPAEVVVLRCTTRCPLCHSHDDIQDTSRGLGVFLTFVSYSLLQHTHKFLLDNAEQMFSLLQIISRFLTECLGTLPHAGAAFRGQTLLPSWLLRYCDSAISSTFSLIRWAALEGGRLKSCCN